MTPKNLICRLAIALGLLVSTLQVGAQGATAWVKRYHSVSDSKDTPVALASDSSGNFIVAGNTVRRDGFTDIVLIKYSGPGVALWTNYYDGLTHDSDFVKAITTDENNNIYVTGSGRSGSTGEDLITIAYSSAGMPLWTNLYLANSVSVGPDRGKAVVARSNMVYVVGEGQFIGNGGPNPDCVTLAYTSAGVPVWTNIFSWALNQPDMPNAIALGSQGEVYVTGYSSELPYWNGVFTYYNNGGYTTVGYSASGSATWTNRYREPFQDAYGAAIAMVTDATGNIYMTGNSGNYYNRDFATVAYSSDGTELWVNRYAGFGNRSDSASGLVIGYEGNIYMTGTSMEGDTGNDYTTIAYSSSGNQLWISQFGGGLTNSDSAVGIATDGTNIFVTGTSVGFAGASDIQTVAYSESGVPLWTNSFAVAGGTATALKIAYADGRVVVMGTSSIAGNNDIVTVAYSTSGTSLWTNSYNGVTGYRAYVEGVAVDKNGKVYVVGESQTIVTLAYDSDGTELWTNRIDTYNDGLIAVDSSNDVYVALEKFGIAKYSSQGAILWTNYLSASSDGTVTDVTVDSSNRVYMTGYLNGSYRTVAFSSTGTQLWTGSVSGGGALAVAAGQNGSVYVTGGAGGSTTVGYAANNGSQSWLKRFGYIGADVQVVGRDLTVAANGNVYVAANARQTYNTDDYATIAYSSTGVPLWTNLYTFSATTFDIPAAITTDSNNNVYVTGYSYNAAGNQDYATIAYSASGVALWTNRYDSGYNEEAEAIATDNQNIYVTGTAYGAPDQVITGDLVTVAYSKLGVPLWTNRYNGPDNNYDYVRGKTSIKVVPGGVIIAGTSRGINGIDEFVVIKYSTLNQAPVSAGFGGATLRDQPLLIAVPNLLAVTSDPEGGPVSFVSVPATSANGGAVSLASGIVTYMPPAGFVGADQFTYVVSDTQGATSSVLARIAVLPPGTVINGFASPNVGSASANLSFAGSPGDSWTIQRAAQVTGPWVNVGTIEMPGNGLAAFQDLNAPTSSAFYRAVKP